MVILYKKLSQCKLEIIHCKYFFKTAEYLKIFIKQLSATYFYTNWNNIKKVETYTIKTMWF